MNPSPPLSPPRVPVSPTAGSVFIPHQRAISPHQRAVPCVATSGNVAANENAVRSWLNRISPVGREGIRIARGGAEGRAGGEGTEGRSVQRTGESGNGAALRHSDTRAHVKWRVHARRKARKLSSTIHDSSRLFFPPVFLPCRCVVKEKTKRKSRSFLPPPPSSSPFSFLLFRFGSRVKFIRESVYDIFLFFFFFLF